MKKPRIGSWPYYLLLASVAIFILGPLGGVTAAYMNFSLGFFVGGQVLAGILGSVVTLPYGAEGKHGANYMQTMAASVASMAAMGVLLQAMVWLGMKEPPVWQLILYFLCIGMFGVGVGMLYTPILVDRLKLTYPSGLAVANILRALTDTRILKRSVTTLGSGIGIGVAVAAVIDRLTKVFETAQERIDKAGLAMVKGEPLSGFEGFAGMVANSGFSVANFGGGIILGARITASAIVVAVIGELLRPWLISHGYIGEKDPFRKIGFIFALGTILGAALVDLSLLAIDAIAKVRAARGTAQEASTTKVGRLLAWVGFWAAALMVVATQVLAVPWYWVAFAIALAFVFQMINGISQGITDQNPISSAFVVTVLLMALLGLRDPLIGLFAGTILLVSCTVGVDMQQDRSTGWRLGSDRSIQFRFQVIGVVMGALIAVLMTRVFLSAYPVLKENLFLHPELREGAARQWQSAMTYKFVGVLNTLSQDKSKTLSVMGLGVLVGLLIEVLRKRILRDEGYKAWAKKSPVNGAMDFALDGLIIASPYASSFGGFVDLGAAIWFGLGGIVSSLYNLFTKPKHADSAAHGPDGEQLPEDMSTTSLIGGGLIAGDSLFALYLGLSGLISSGAIFKIFGGG